VGYVKDDSIGNSSDQWEDRIGDSRLLYTVELTWTGAEDIEKMADLGTLTGLTITMKKEASSLKVESPLMEKLKDHYKDPNATPGTNYYVSDSIRD
jgi:hypothetical protein